jgi:hypothetical protein
MGLNLLLVCLCMRPEFFMIVKIWFWVMILSGSPHFQNVCHEGISNAWILTSHDTGWCTKWFSIWSINKSCISITILETYKEKDHCMEIYPLLIKYSIWPPLRLATSSIWTVILISWWHISSFISLQDWMISALDFITVCVFFRKTFSLKNPQRN